MSGPYEKAYDIVTQAWGDKKSSTEVPYMEHIDLGLKVLRRLEADKNTKAAFCLHGLFQSDIALISAYSAGIHDEFSSEIILLVMEYRNIANQWLRTQGWSSRRPPAIPLQQVEQMLVADKVVNYYNLMENNTKHPDYLELDNYFRLWLQHLGVSYEDYADLMRAS